MINDILKGGYDGSGGILETTIANQEIIPQATAITHAIVIPQLTQENTRYISPYGLQSEYEKVEFYEFYFVNLLDCTVKINGGNPIFLKAGIDAGDFTFTINSQNTMISSFVIVEPNITYNWISSYR